MKRVLFAVALMLTCGLFGMQANAQSKLDKIVGSWLMKSDMNGQVMEFTFKVLKTDAGVFASLEMPNAPEQKLEIKEVDGKLVSTLEIPEYGAKIDIGYAFVNDDTVNVSIDTGDFAMESPMTRIKE